MITRHQAETLIEFLEESIAKLPASEMAFIDAAAVVIEKARFSMKRYRRAGGAIK